LPQQKALVTCQGLLLLGNKKALYPYSAGGDCPIRFHMERNYVQPVVIQFLGSVDPRCSRYPFRLSFAQSGSQE
jgi:hypothetical protein